jgi:hypothetical protein
MGKQSKRKAVSKKEHKERQEERRIRALQEVSTRNNDDDDDANDEPYDSRVDVIMVGDRVWWRDQPQWQRGIVRSVVADKLEPGMTRYMVQNIEDGDGDQLIVVAVSTSTGSVELMKTIKRDRNDWVPYFSVGDRVLFHARKRGNRQDDNSINLRVPATVSKLWVTPPDDNETLHVSFYMCEVNAPVGVISAGTSVYVEQDSADMIVKHSTTFRFSVGDAVLFSTDKALFYDSQSSSKSAILERG